MAEAHYYRHINKKAKVLTFQGFNHGSVEQEVDPYATRRYTVESILRFIPG